MESLFHTPAEIAEKTMETAEKKIRNPAWKTLILGFLAGAFIALAAEGSNMAAFNLLASPGTYGLGKTLAGCLFGTGLMLVILCGAELFTGNCLIVMGAAARRVTVGGMLRNWLYVYAGNLAGSLLVAFMIVHSGQLGSGNDLLAAVTIKIAAGKVDLSFIQALFLGILCNWLVCLAVWMATAAKDVSGKIWAVFFPILLFITSGFEHSIANMYYIPAGILAKRIPAYAQAAIELGVSSEHLDTLTWTAMWKNNLLPVTLGNILGGCILVGLAYWLLYARGKE